METRVITIDGAGLGPRLEALAEILVGSVAGGAAIGFMAPLAETEARRFWAEDVRAEIEAGRRVLFGAERAGRLLGTVQLVTAMPPNQPHRCEIAKMMVHPAARRQGIGRQLMTAALGHARGLGRTLVTLDTRSGDAAAPLYASVGFEVAGEIPDFAWDPDGRARHATTYMYRRL
ncbi:GNAT family N-acetyltransferase [Poseidonocella sp. HB161398]|uniref:GNAT family N-acetyltransferase n=1 Tax=Poseidonocella sp. HB161398 TaxID=2320855 RepID=UPI001107B0D6|nr:GNAT family N-acetyltransferase [Poseidonocella sp. HB161398]